MIIPTTDKEGRDVWTISEAKARLSELLRLASVEPQYIGTKAPYVLVPADQWEELVTPTPPMGQWMVDNFSAIGELELPDRNEPDREIPFQ